MKLIKKIVGSLLGKSKQFSGMDNDDIHPEKITIGITTFEARFEQYFVPLLLRIREYAGNEVEVIVAINGENDQPFGEDYRKKILSFVANQVNVYPIVFPRFRGLSKLWNSIVIHATNDKILMLNDDIMIEKREFMTDVCNTIRRNEGRMFLINRSWSHFMINRDEVDELGYFDERLLGIGEEDGDMTWRYISRYGREIPTFKIKGIDNFAEATTKTYKPVNIQTRSGSKYSLFNRRFMFEEKYKASTEGVRGMFDEPVILNIDMNQQYPYEAFYRLRKKDL